MNVYWQYIGTALSMFQPLLQSTVVYWQFAPYWWYDIPLHPIYSTIPSWLVSSPCLLSPLNSHWRKHVVRMYLRDNIVGKVHSQQELNWLVDWNSLTQSIVMIIPNIWKNKKCSKPPTRKGSAWKRIPHDPSEVDEPKLYLWPLTIVCGASTKFAKPMKHIDAHDITQLL